MQPSNTTTIASCKVKEQSYQAFGYVGADQRLYMEVQQGEPSAGWTTIDLMADWQAEVNIGLPFPRPGAGPRGDGPIAMNAFEQIVGFFLFYVDSNNHILALPYPVHDSVVAPAGFPPDGTLTDALYPDLTVRTGAPAAADDSPIACYAWESAKSQHVVYIGADRHVWELYWNGLEYDPKRGGPMWRSNDLSVRTGYTGVLAAKRGSPLAATMFEREGSEHVIYIGGDNTIRELYFYNGGWGGNNLSQATGAVPPAADSPLSTFACTYEDTLHVVYIGQDGLVHELWWAPDGWHPDHVISGISVQPARDTALTGYACEFEKSHHVVYIDVNDNIQELYRHDGSWGNTTLSVSAGSGATPPLRTASPLSGNSDEDEKAQRVFYLDSMTRVHELYRHNNEWIAGQTAG